MYCVGYSSEIEEISGIMEWDLLTCKNNVNTPKQAEKVIALAQLFVIMDYYNDDFDFTDKDRYYPSMYLVKNEMEFDELHSYTQCPIYFKSLEVAKEAYNNNKEIFETFFKP
jgi:hypothetical protein